jgi:hypothetical protein
MSKSPRAAAYIAATILALGTTSALAQSVGTTETFGPDGVVPAEHALAPAQKAAIYNLVAALKARWPAGAVSDTIGATVPPTAELHAIPAETETDDTPQLKYAFMEDKVVVVDPIRMRVVDVIHRTSLP